MVKGSDHCFAVYQGDLAPALMALEAKVKLMRAGGERIIPFREFFTNDGKSPNVLELGEILTEVRIPPLSKHVVGAYQKFRVRGAMDFPLVSVAVLLDMNGKKSCRKAKIILGAVASAPIEASEAEEILLNKRIDNGLAEEAAQEAFKRTHPVANLSLDPDYRRKMVKVMLKRAINQALGLAKTG